MGRKKTSESNRTHVQTRSKKRSHCEDMRRVSKDIKKFFKKMAEMLILTPVKPNKGEIVERDVNEDDSAIESVSRNETVEISQINVEQS